MNTDSFIRKITISSAIILDTDQGNLLSNLLHKILAENQEGIMKIILALYFIIVSLSICTPAQSKERHNKHVDSVKVVNTPNVNVVNIPQVEATITSPVTANIANPVEVHVNDLPGVIIDNETNNPVPVHIVNEQAQQHLMLALFGQFTAGTELIEDYSVFPRGYTIPAGKRFYLDLAFCNTSTNSGEVTVRFSTFVHTDNNVSTGLLIPVKMQRLGADQTLYGTLNLPIALSANKLTDQILLTARRTITTNNSIVKCMLHGRLQDLN